MIAGVLASKISLELQICRPNHRFAKNAEIKVTDEILLGYDAYEGLKDRLRLLMVCDKKFG